MKLPEILTKKARRYELVAATYHNKQSVRIKIGAIPLNMMPRIIKGTEWAYIRPESKEEYRTPKFFKPTHHKFEHIGCHLWLRDNWPKYKRVDNYLSDIFFFEDNKPKKHDTKIAKDRFNQRTNGGQKSSILLCR